MGLLVLLVVVGAAQVGMRYLFDAPLSWSEELLKFAHIWLVFLAIPITYRRAGHVVVDILSSRAPAAARRALEVAVDALWLAFACGFAWLVWLVMAVARNQTSAGLRVRMDLVYAGMLIGCAYLAFCAVRRLAGHLRRPAGEPLGRADVAGTASGRADAGGGEPRA